MKADFEYSVEQRALDAHPGITASTLLWGRAVPGTARALLAEAEKDPAADCDEHSSPDAVEAFLRDLLADGRPISSKDVKAAIHQAGGWSWTSVHRVAKRMGVQVKKARGSLNGGWYWSLPRQPSAPEDAEDSEDADPASLASSESSERSAEWMAGSEPRDDE